MKSDVLVLAVAMTVIATPSLAQDKPVTLRISHWVPASHILHKSVENWAASVERASGGTIKSQIYPAQQLGKAVDNYDMVRDGIADVVYVSPGYQPGRFPIVGLADIPFTISEVHGGIRAIDSWYRKYAPTEMKDVKYCFSFITDPSSWHSKKKIVTPDDIKGIKMRPSTATIGSWIVQLGGTNVQAGAPEVRDVLEKGVADAVIFPWGTTIAYGVDKVTKFHMDASISTASFQWLINQRAYDNLSPAQKKMIDEHCTTEWAGRFAGPWGDFERAGLAKLKEMPGHDVYQITPEQLAAWKKSTDPLRQAWANSVRKNGADPDRIAQEFADALKQYNAGY
ncbi:TRAP transporter substrate-binding protein [Pseudorhodoplanes sp.]|uniref:TRAP transporter substrate-binding protein n=1 Tax=Pseudorhodoplanes sp. TaxID=1934341 RepID=UPI003D0E592E